MTTALTEPARRTDRPVHQDETFHRPDAPPHTITDEALDLLAQLRSIIPGGPLGTRDAERLAERQAEAIRRYLGISGGHVSTEALHSLPFLMVSYRKQFPVSGLTARIRHGWIIIIRSDEPVVRQRFSLAHEIKHLIDHPLMVTSEGLYPATRTTSSEERAERTCDAFAAALLMPRAHLRQDWRTGRTNVRHLARRYGVSRTTMNIRLRQLRLIHDTGRVSR